MERRPRLLPRPFSMPWGKGQIVQETQVQQHHWEPTIQLMEYEDGSRALRFCTYNQGRFSRNPMILAETDVDDMRSGIADAPEIRDFLISLLG